MDLSNLDKEIWALYRDRMSQPISTETKKLYIRCMMALLSKGLDFDSPFYLKIDLYLAFQEAKQYLEDSNLEDICIGTYNNQTELKIFCLFHHQPKYQPDNQLIIFISGITPEKPPKIKIKTSNRSTQELFHLNDLINWVAFGTYEDQPDGFLIGMSYSGICPFGQKSIPAMYQGYPVYYFRMPYQPCNYQKVLKMGDEIFSEYLKRGFGTLGGFIRNSQGEIFGISNYHVIFRDKNSTYSRVFQPSYEEIINSRDPKDRKSKGVNYYIIGETDINLSCRDNIMVRQNQLEYPMGLDVGIFKLEKRRFSPELRYRFYDDLIIQPNSSVKHPEINQLVFKCGARTRLNSGIVFSDYISVRNCPRLHFYSTYEKISQDGSFDPIICYNQFMILSRSNDPTGFCVPGDSGSIVLSEEVHPVGLLHGSLEGNNYAIATDLVYVISYLESKMGPIEFIDSNPC